jgi:hypothetical protein
MEILVGSNSPITHKVFWQGQLTDADGVVGAKVYDITEDPAITPAINPGVIQTTLIAVKSEVDAGTYTVYLPYEYTNRQRQLKFVWSCTVNGQTVQKEHKVFVQTPYTDLSQAVDALGLGSDYSDPNTKSYFELCNAERYARKIIEAYTGQQFYLYDDVQTVYGADSDVLPLPYRINDLHELYQNDVLLVDKINNINNWNYDTIISESGFGIRVNRATMLDNTVYIANGMVPPTINDTWGGSFSNGSTYRVQGRFGWADVPDEIDLACIELMRDYFSKDKVWRNKYMKSIKTFDWQFEYNSSTYSGTGNVFADQLLSTYVINKMVVI